MKDPQKAQKQQTRKEDSVLKSQPKIKSQENLGVFLIEYSYPTGNCTSPHPLPPDNIFFC